MFEIIRIITIIFNVMEFKIVKDNKKSLRERSKDIELPLSDEIITLGHQMIEYLKNSQDEEYLKAHPKVRSGVGLACPQIGKNINMVAIYFKDEENKETQYVLVNPKIISESTKLQYLSGGEGCLSVDGDHPGLVYRPYRIKVRCFDLLKNEPKEYVFTDYLAIVAGHEIDHLKGILFYDHIDKQNPFKEIPGAVKI